MRCSMNVDALVQLPLARADDVLGVGEAERHEQQPGLVHVVVVLVDHRDRGGVVPSAGAAGGWP